MLELDTKYGLDRQEIVFTPNCDNHKEHDVLMSEKFNLFCVKPGTYVLVTNKSRDFVTGYDLMSVKFTVR